MSGKKTVGIIIVNYNGLQDTLECVESIKNSNTKYDVKIIVVDNCSKENELEKISRVDSCIICIQSDKNGGFSYGNNIGIKWAIENKCDYIMLLNNDTIIKKDMIDILLDSCDSQIVAPTMLYYGDKNLAWYAGGYINRKTGNGEHKHINEYIDIDTMNNEICTFATGCCFAAETKTIQKIGFLEDSYFMYCEDTDYCIRAALSGIQIEYVPKAVLWHKVSKSTGGSDSPFATYYMTRNRLNYVKKYHNYFNYGAYTFSLLTRIIRLVFCKDKELMAAFSCAIVDHFRGKGGKRY